MMTDDDKVQSSGDIDQHTRLFFEAIEKGDYATVEICLGDGIDLTVRNNMGWTALMVAVMFRKKEIVRLLVKKGVDVNAQSFSGLTALKMAEYSKNEDIVRLLKLNGAKD
ncbi:MAG: ankyrin repeat domain-containing protein [bacterium]